MCFIYQVHVTWCPFQLDDQPTKPIQTNKLHSGLRDSKKSQALAWWRNLWKLAISLQSSQGTGTPVLGDTPYVSDVDVGIFVQKRSFFVNGILIQCGIFFLDFKKTPTSLICFRNLEHQNYAIHFNRSPMICWHFTGLSLPPPRGNEATTLSTS